ncbi:MAG TPA: DUF721 domain-containing protein [bacterium]|nr:DUF721 domain-containing protein [bacterium]
MKHIKEAVETFIKKARIGERQEERFIADNWEKIVGSKAGSMTKPFKFKDGKLFVSVENSVAMGEAVYVKKAMIESINRAFKEKKVKEIIMRIEQ